jgi:phage shock protein A
MSEFAERIDAAVASWKAKLRPAQERATDSSSARAAGDATALRRVVADLEGDLATLLERVAHDKARAGEFETRAMKAIHENDDWAAREALLGQQQLVDTLQQLDSEVIVLQAMLAECRAILDQTGA